MQHNAIHRSTLQHTALKLQLKTLPPVCMSNSLATRATPCYTLLHTAHIAEHSITIQTLQHTAAHCSTMQSILQHTAAHCKTMQLHCSWRHCRARKCLYCKHRGYVSTVYINKQISVATYIYTYCMDPEYKFTIYIKTHTNVKILYVSNQKSIHTLRISLACNQSHALSLSTCKLPRLVDVASIYI